MLPKVKRLITPKSVLIVIDMQTGFATANDENTIDKCKDLILAFKQKNLPIVCLLYGKERLAPKSFYSYGPLLPPLSKLIKNYPLAKTITKHCDSGATQVNKHLKDKSLHLFLCGVNTSSCVSATAEGLVSYGFSEVHVVVKACNDEYDERGVGWTGMFKKIGAKPV